jgi:glycosyltransferase involved in cell wall biosynthesis
MKNTINKSLTIGIDANEANTFERVGVNQYAFEILWALYRLIKKNNRDVKLILFLKNKPISTLPKEKSWWKYKVLSESKFWVLTKLTIYLLFHHGINVFYTPSHYLPLLTKIPKICTIHDLGYLKFSGQFKKYDFWQLKYWTAISVSISKYIITFSKSNANDIVRQYPFASNKLQIIYHGYNNKRFNTKISKDNVRRVIEKYNLPENYILFLGTLKPSKNIEGLVGAFRKLRLVDKDIKLVIAGKKGWLFQSIYDKAIKWGLSDQIVFTGFVDEADKPALMSNAKVFACVSFWEGFGIPVVESMACGTPVVVSNVGSLPEVAGKAGVYVDPSSEMSIYLGLKKVLFMRQKMYNKLIGISVAQAKKFSWEKSAVETLEVLTRIKA